MIDLIGFDADDTLWHNETLYHEAQDGLKRILSAYHPPEEIERVLYQTEMRNLAEFGYGIKAFMLSMIESAIEISEMRICAREIQQILELGKHMLKAEVRLLDGVRETLAALAETYPLILITKGDLLDQEAKVTRSGLASYFRAVEVVSHKNPASYRRVLERQGVAPERFLMVGNSLKSDILPVVEVGGRAVFIPYPLTWAHEQDVGDLSHNDRMYEVGSIYQLPGLLERLEEEG